MTLAELVTTHRPESHGRGETWPQHARRLWASETLHMILLALIMTARDTWVYGPVITDDGVVQDAHHRIVVALGLGWSGRDIPVRAAR